MGIILHEVIRTLLQNKAPVQDIRAELQNRYDDERMLSDYVLLCYAIHNHHTALMRECIASAGPSKPQSILKPFVIAVEARNAEAIDLLLAHQEPVNLMGYGLRKDGQFEVYGSITTIMKRDDVEFLTKLIDVYKEKDQVLAHLALVYDAPQCFSVITDRSHPSLTELDQDGKDILLAAASSRLSLLEKVIQLGFKDCGQTDFRQQTTLHRCVSSSSHYYQQRDRSKALFIPEDTKQKIELLMSVGARAAAHDKDQQLAIDFLLSQPAQQIRRREDITPPYPLQQHSRLVLQCCQLLLDNMKAEMGSRFRVPNRTFHVLQGNLQGILSKAVPAAYTSSLISCLTLVNDMSTMFLRYGVDLTAKEPHLLLDACFMQCVTYTVKKLVGEMGKYLHEHIMKLLAYGANFTEKSSFGLQQILKEKPAYMDETVPVCMSLMDHVTYQKFMESLRDERQKAARRQEADDHLEKELEIEDFRSLKQLCRLKLYDHVPNRNMAVHSHQLPLPEVLKSFLRLGVDL